MNFFKKHLGIVFCFVLHVTPQPRKQVWIILLCLTLLLCGCSCLGFHVTPVFCENNFLPCTHFSIFLPFTLVAVQSL